MMLSIGITGILTGGCSNSANVKEQQTPLNDHTLVGKAPDGHTSGRPRLGITDSTADGIMIARDTVTGIATKAAALRTHDPAGAMQRYASAVSEAHKAFLGIRRHGRRASLQAVNMLLPLEIDSATDYAALASSRNGTNLQPVRVALSDMRSTLPDAYRSIDDALIERRYTEALNLYSGLLFPSPNSTMAGSAFLERSARDSLRLGLANAVNGNPAAARHELNGASDAVPTSHYPPLFLGILDVMQHRPFQARQHFARVVQTPAPAEPSTRHDFGTLSAMRMLIT